jgi:hypothetical protein
MLLKKPPIPGKPISNQGNAIAYVEYIVNQRTLKAYNDQKRLFHEQEKVNSEKQVREILLFHGTDTGNIDSILEKNFAIDHVSSHKKKLMIYGAGVYMSEHPEIAHGYGSKILLCKVG